MMGFWLIVGESYAHTNCSQSVWVFKNPHFQPNTASRQRYHFRYIRRPIPISSMRKLFKPNDLEPITYTRTPRRHAVDMRRHICTANHTEICSAGRARARTRLCSFDPLYLCIYLAWRGWPKSNHAIFVRLREPLTYSHLCHPLSLSL